MERIRIWNDNRIRRKVKITSLKYGTVFSKHFTRKWYSPLRYILGRRGITIVTPDKFLIDTSPNHQ